MRPITASITQWEVNTEVIWGFPGGSNGEEAACNVGDLGSAPGSRRPPGEGSSYPLHYSCWRIPRTEEPGGLQRMGSQRVRHDWATNTHTYREVYYLMKPCSWVIPWIHAASPQTALKNRHFVQFFLSFIFFRITVAPLFVYRWARVYMHVFVYISLSHAISEVFYVAFIVSKWSIKNNLKFILSCKFNQFSSVAQSCLTLCDPMNHSRPGLPVHHQLPEFTQTHVHRVGDAIQPSHPLLSPSLPAPNPSQHQSLFQWVNSSHDMAKVLEFQLQHQSFQWTPRTDLLKNGLVGFSCSPRDSQESSPTPQFKSINSSVLSSVYSPILTSIHN